MKPLDTKPKPRDRDLIDFGSDEAAKATPSPKLSAELIAQPDPATTLLHAINAEGEVFSLTGTGNNTPLNFPNGHQALEIAAANPEGAVFVLAGTLSAPSTSVQRDYALWRHETQGWRRVLDIPGCAARPVIAGSAQGVWVSTGTNLALFDNDKLGLAEPLDFSPTAISEGCEGTVWLLGGEKRYGGVEVRRYDHPSGRWFLLPPPAAAISLAASSDGTAWGVSTKGELWRFSRDGAGTFRECGNDADCRRCFYKPDRSFVRSVAMGNDGNVWILSGRADEKGYEIERMVDLGTRETHQPNPALRAVSIAAARVAR